MERDINLVKTICKAPSPHLHMDVDVFVVDPNVIFGCSKKYNVEQEEVGTNAPIALVAGHGNTCAQ